MIVPKDQRKGRKKEQKIVGTNRNKREIVKLNSTVPTITLNVNGLNALI